MFIGNYYDLAWRASKSGLRELEFLLRPLGFDVEQVEAECAKALGANSLSELNLGLRFSCSVMIILASLASQLPSLLIEASLSSGFCDELNVLTRQLRELASRFKVDLGQEGALYRISETNVFRSASLLAKLVEDEASLAKTLCGGSS